MTGREKPRIGFAGVGWIGLSRMRAIVDSGAAEVVAIADPDPEMRRRASEWAPEAALFSDLNSMMGVPMDGIAIATPSALHAQAVAQALDQGLAVFCQKPLACSWREAQSLVDLARRQDRLLAVDLSYRYAEAFCRAREAVDRGEIGQVHYARLVFHNAYGPDKTWYRDPVQSGGGCMIDLGTHLVDLAMWTLGWPDIDQVHADRFSHGQRLLPAAQEVEDLALAYLRSRDGCRIEVACSWNMHAGRDAVISAEFYGTEGGAIVRNVDGSFYDFAAERLRGTQRESVARPPDGWYGRAAAVWAARLAESNRFDAEAEHYAALAALLDRIYQRL